MKIRNGFVSNSSSSSFCIFGAYLEGDRAKEVDNRIDNDNKFCKQLKDFGFEYFYGDPNNYDTVIYIGKSWDSIGDEETGNQFKNSILENLKVLLSDESVECGTHEAAWYDG